MSILPHHEPADQHLITALLAQFAAAEQQARDQLAQLDGTERAYANGQVDAFAQAQELLRRAADLPVESDSDRD